MLEPPKPLGADEGFDEFFEEAVKLVCKYDRASAPLLQRRLSIGYARAARLIDQLEKVGVVGPQDGSLPRLVLINSFEEFLKSQGKSTTSSEKADEDPFSVSKNYRVPTDIKLSKDEKPEWGPQFADVYKSNLKDKEVPYPVAVGYDEKENIVVESLIDIGNLIVVGNPLSRKEVFVDSVLLAFLFRYTPSELRLILVDEAHYLDLYNGMPHLLSPVITEHDKSISALRWTMYEMKRRMKAFSEAGVRDIKAYNKLSGLQALPHILLVMFPAWYDDETASFLTVLADTGPRTGIHNILVANQMDKMNFPKEVKANVPARLVLKVTSAGESRSAEVKGGESLQPGEAIYKSNGGQITTVKTVFTPDVNVKEVVTAIMTE